MEIVIFHFPADIWMAYLGLIPPPTFLFLLFERITPLFFKSCFTMRGRHAEQFIHPLYLTSVRSEACDTGGDLDK